MRLRDFVRNILASSFVAAVASATASAQSHEHHVKHNLLVFGNAEIYASHLVYKSPHNHQVVLRLRLEAAELRAYHGARAAFPRDKVLLLLNPVDISRVAQATSLSGVLLRVDGDGKKITLVPEVRLDHGEFTLLYSAELPLSLEPDPR